MPVPTSPPDSTLNPSLTRQASALRALAMDAVEAAGSGHPGLPLGMADAATVLFSRVLKYDATAPEWPDRDRFVLSAGHGSMLLYGLLHLTGYDLALQELQNFRQWNSKTPGHPEYRHTPGVETTTGPLGQGLANAVGMAIAERSLAADFGTDLVAHRTFVLAGDGCLMEGVGYEAASLAGHLGLGKLIVLWDDNRISIDGATRLSFSEDVIARFAANGWQCITTDGHNPAAVEAALVQADAEVNCPSLIACRTTIGFGAPSKAGTAASHGAPLGAEEVAGVRTAIDWHEPPFVIPDEVYADWRQAGSRGKAIRQAWQARLDASPHKEAFTQRMSGQVPAAAITALTEKRQRFLSDKPKMASRQASGEVLATISPACPSLIGGSADLTGSNLTRAPDQAAFHEDASGRYIFYGVREHAMAAAMNGLALHGGFIPYGGTFLVFSDYARPSIRLAALMGLRAIFVMTHDSIGLGEDGPTHQPIEHLAALRAIPNLRVFRPCDAVETAEAWHLALTSETTPSLLALSRQGLETLREETAETTGNRTGANRTGANRTGEGAYVLRQAQAGKRVVTLLATGSEVALACAAHAQLESEGIATAVVSMPCWELFAERTAAEQQAVLGANTVRLAIEAASPFGWQEWLTGASAADTITLNRFGASAPAARLFAELGFTAEAIVARVHSLLAEAKAKTKE